MKASSLRRHLADMHSVYQQTVAAEEMLECRPTETHIVSKWSHAGLSCPTYINAQHRCRAPLLNESLPQLDLVASWEGETSKGQKVTLVTQLNLERWYWAVLQIKWARRCWFGQGL
jgi:hypothetical protein